MDQIVVEMGYIVDSIFIRTSENVYAQVVELPEKHNVRDSHK